CNLVKAGGLRRAVYLLLLFSFFAGQVGCTRSFYRRAADKEVNDILAEKDKFPEWKIEQFHVYPDPRARFADPTDPDHPPMPADDEGAYKLSPHSQGPGHPGVGHVEGNGYLEMVKAWHTENRADRDALKKQETAQAAQRDAVG